MAAGDDPDTYSEADGELSFSRWRTNRRPQQQQNNNHNNNDTSEDVSLDFHSQFDNRWESVDTETTSEKTTGISLGERRGVNITIVAPNGGDPISRPEDNAHDAYITDQEFEKEFGLHGPSPRDMFGRRHHSRFTSELQSVSLGDDRDNSHDDDDGVSRGSSELSFQDLVERQGESFFSSKQTVLVVFLRTLLFILIWYLFSTGLTIYNKKLLGQHLWDFPAPMLMNTVHFTMQAIVSTVALRFFCRSLRPTTTMTWKDYAIRVVPTAIATALDINFTNASLVFISVSFETMCKSSAPVFLLIFAFAFKLETPSFKLFGIISIISSGVLLTGLASLLSTKQEEQQFEVLGFVLVILAAIMSGFRWTVTQVLLQRKEFGLNNPLAVMSNLAPVMAAVTAVLSLASEPLHKLSEDPFFNTPHNALKSSLLLLLGGVLAFFMVLAEYILISKTSAVTLTVAGVVKEMVTILVAVLFFGDKFTLLTGLGLAVIMIGVSWFNVFKYQKFRENKHVGEIEFEKINVRYAPLTTAEENESL